MRVIRKPEDLLKVFEEDERPTVNSPISFVNEHMYWFMPLAQQYIDIVELAGIEDEIGGRKSEDGKKEDTNKERTKKGDKNSKKKKATEKGDGGDSITITYLGVLGFAHGIVIAPTSIYRSLKVAQLGIYSKYFAQPEFEIGDVQFTYYKNQGVQLKRAIKEVLFGEDSVCKFDSSEIFNAVAILLWYVKYDNEITAYIVAAWILGTYLFPMFNYYPYLYFRAEKGSGKGTNLQIVSRLAWNATDKFVASKEAPLFRLIEKAKPTLILDEYHRLLRNPYIGPAIEAILEGGSEKGAKVVRCNEKDPDKIDHFDVYCPKVLASRKRTEIEEKSILIILPKTNDVRYAERRKELDYDERFEKVKYGLLKLAIASWQQIYQEYKAIRPTKNLTGRAFNFWAPILAISSVVFPDKYAEILRYAEDQTKKSLGERFEIEDIVLTALYEHRTDLALGDDLDDLSAFDEDHDVITSLKEIRNWTELHHNTIYSALSNLKLIKTSRPGKLYLRAGRLRELFIERGFIDEEELEGGKSEEEAEPEEYDFSLEEVLGYERQ